jgi:hypothetical protein
MSISRHIKSVEHCGAVMSFRAMHEEFSLSRSNSRRTVLSTWVAAPDFDDPALTVVILGLDRGEEIEVVCFWVAITEEMADGVVMIDGRPARQPRPWVLEELRAEAERLCAQPGFRKLEKIAA